MRSFEVSRTGNIGLGKEFFMKSKNNSVHLHCVFCALLSGILWLLLSRGQFLSVATADDSQTIEKNQKNVKENSRRYEFRNVHDPDGLGKFYMGREIAQVMGFQA